MNINPSTLFLFSGRPNRVLPMIALLFFFQIGFYACNSSYYSLNFGKGELLYHPQIPIDWAQQTGETLYKLNFLGDERKTSVLLLHNNDTLKLHIVVDPLYFYDTSYDPYFNSLLQALQKEKWSQNQVWQILLSDRNLNPHRVLE